MGDRKVNMERGWRGERRNLGWHVKRKVIFNENYEKRKKFIFSISLKLVPI